MPERRSARRETGDTARIVSEAETLVHCAWLDELCARLVELEDGLARAVARMDEARRQARRASESGDRRNIRATRAALQASCEAVRRADLAREQLRHVLDHEAGGT